MDFAIELSENQEYSYIGKNSAWRHLGIVMDRLMSYQKDILPYCLDWKVYKRQLPHPDSEYGLIDAWGFFRSDNQAFMGLCSEKAEQVPHSKGFEIIQELLGEEYCFAAAGTLGEKNTKVWGLAPIGQSRLGDDVTNTFLLFCKSYDQSIANTWKLVRNRVICDNTHSVELNEKGFSLSIKNTKNSVAILKNRMRAIESIKEQVANLDKNYALLASKKASEMYIQTVLERLFPLTDTIDEITKNPVMVSSTRRKHMVEKIHQKFESNNDNAFPEQKGTLFNLFNAITDFVDHDRSTKGNDKKHAEAAMFGSGDEKKSEAFELILSMADKAEDVSRPLFMTVDNN